MDVYRGLTRLAENIELIIGKRLTAGKENDNGEKE